MEEIYGIMVYKKKKKKEGFRFMEEIFVFGERNSLLLFYFQSFDIEDLSILGFLFLLIMMHVVVKVSHLPS